MMKITILEWAFVAMGCVYISLATVTGFQLVRILQSYSPWTAQKITHFLMFILTCVRATWLLLVGVGWCGATTGKLSHNCDDGQREVFYILDQLPGVLFFSIYTLLVLFWAEVYYNATDCVELYMRYIKPFAKFFNVAAYVVQIAFWILYSTVWSGKNHYVGGEYAFFNFIIFLVMAFSFIYFGRKAYVEMRSIPVELDIRNRKLMEVAMMTTIFTSCFTLRSIILLWIASQKEELHAELTWLIVVIYFGVLEVVPCLVLLYFHRRLPITSSGPISAAQRYTILPGGPRNLERESLHKTLLPHIGKPT